MKKMAHCALLFVLVCLLSLSQSRSPYPAEAGSDAREIWLEPLTGMEFVSIPGGCYRMGSPEDEKGRDPDEGPVHEVCVDGFWMGRYEVTRGEFRTFVEATGYRSDAEKEGFSWIYSGQWEKKAGYDWRKAGFEQEDRQPVVNVSWNDATMMAQWLTAKSRSHFRLASEAEWEYACRANSSDARYWGDDPDAACTHANVADLVAKQQFPAWSIHECRDEYVFAAPTGHFRPNAFGLYDMLGNVWEWCQDTYRADAYTKHVGKNPITCNSQPDRLMRGGSWHSRPDYVRCASREQLQSPARRSDDLGFRLVRIP